MKKNLLIIPLLFLTVIVFGTNLSAQGETCGAPLIVAALPFTDAGNTSTYGDNYGTTDVPPLAANAVTNGTGSEYYLTGDDVVYRITPSLDGTMTVSTTNDDNWIGLWVFENCPFTSTVGYHTAISGATRSIPSIPVQAGMDYFIVISSWDSHQSTAYTIEITGSPGLLTPPSCMFVNSLTLDNLTANDADISWTAGGSESAWNVSWGTPGYTPGDANEVGTSSVATNSYQITGLTPETDYEFYVQADCGGGDESIWIGPYSFTTPPTCPAPTDLDIQNLTATSVDLEWTEAGAATDWNIEYGTYGYTQGDGTVVATTTNPHSLTGLTPETAYDFYVQADCGVSDQSVWVGPFSFTTPPTCPAPTDLAITNLTTTTVDLGWTENGSATEWQVEFGAAGFTQGTGTLETASSNPHSITISPDSEYEFYVRSICTVGDSSYWSGPFDFANIYCVPSNTYSTSYYINDVITSGAIQNLNNTATGFTAGGYADYTATDTLIVYPGQTIDVTLTHPSSTYGYQVWVDWNNNFSFSDAGENIISTGFESTPLTMNLTVPAVVSQGTYRLRVRNAYLYNPAPNCGSFNYGEAEDYTLVVVAQPSCLPTSDIVASNETQTTVDLDWTENNSATTWNIEYGPVGFTPGTGTTISGVTTNPFTVTGLNPSSTYDFYVQSDCGAGDLSSIGFGVTATTLCGVVTAPFYEGFNTGVQPVCWDNLSSNTTSTSANNFWKFSGTVEGGANNNGKPNGTYAFSDGDTPKPDSMMLITPEIDLTALTTPYLGFEWFSNNTNNPGNNIPLIVSIHDGSSWTLLDTLKGDYAEWQFASFDLAAYNNDTVRIRFMTNQTLITTTAWYNDILIDEIRIDDCITGQDGTKNVCRLDGTVDLNDNIVTAAMGGGSWHSDGLDIHLNDSIFEYSTLPSGSYELFYVERFACADTSVATINVYNESTAGEGQTITVCKNEPINLYAALSGNIDMGGDWYDFNDNLLPNSQPTAPSLEAQYNYKYVASNGVCPADTAIVEVNVGNCTWDVKDEMFTDVSVYPNPATSQLNIVNPSNTSSLKVEMLDMNGRVVLVENKALNNASEATLAIDHLERGIYTLRIYNDEGQRTFKVVKQ